MHGQRLDAGPVLRGGVDAFRPLALMDCATGAARAQQPVFDDLGAQHGQLEHLASINHFKLRQRLLACGAVAGRVFDDLIDLGALAQGAALVSRLAACLVLAGLAQ